MMEREATEVMVRHVPLTQHPLVNEVGYIHAIQDQDHDGQPSRPKRYMTYKCQRRGKSSINSIKS